MATPSSSAASADDSIRALLADIRSGQQEQQNFQSTILRGIEDLEKTCRDILALQYQAVDCLQQVQAEQQRITREAVTAALKVRLHEAYHARQQTRYPSNAGTRITAGKVLERILLLLPMRDILFAQRVSRHFLSVIRRSTNIQRRLYIHAYTNDRTGREFGFYVNPLRHQIFSQFTLRYHVDSIDYGEDNEVAMSDAGLARTTMNPKSRETYIDLTGSELNPASINSIKRPQMGCESWRMMFITQPPLPVEITSNGVKVHQCDGIMRMGDLVDALGYGWPVGKPSVKRGKSKALQESSQSARTPCGSADTTTQQVIPATAVLDYGMSASLAGFAEPIDSMEPARKTKPIDDTNPVKETQLVEDTKLQESRQSVELTKSIPTAACNAS